MAVAVSPVLLRDPIPCTQNVFELFPFDLEILEMSSRRNQVGLELGDIAWFWAYGTDSTLSLPAAN